MSDPVTPTERIRQLAAEALAYEDHAHWPDWEFDVMVKMRDALTAIVATLDDDDTWTAGEGFDWRLDGDTVHLRPAPPQTSLPSPITITLPDAARDMTFSDSYKQARGVLKFKEPAEDIIRRMRG